MKTKNITSILVVAFLGYGGLNLLFFTPFSKAETHLQNNNSTGDILVIGTAYDTNGKKLLYKEIHRTQKLGYRSVDYISPQGEIIAKKKLNYTDSLISPSYTQENYWSKEKSHSSWKNGKLYLRFETTSAAISTGENYLIEEGNSQNTSYQKKEKVISIENVVIDAGFDHYIRKHWQALIAGETLHYQFAVASQLTTISMRIQRAPCSKILQGINKTDVACFKSQATGLFLRWFLSPIELSYDINSQRLLRFYGLGNVADSTGSLLKVDIHYDYSQ